MEQSIRDVFRASDVYEKIVVGYESGGTGLRDWKSRRKEGGALFSDIRATFPLIEIGQRWVNRRSPGRELAWMIAAPEEKAAMVDGLPIFTDWHFDGERGFLYDDDGWHLAFVRWLESRGWYLERYDEVWFEPTRLPTAEERAACAVEAKARAIALQGPQLPPHLDIPF